MGEDLIGSLVGSGVSAIASLFGADSQSRNVKRTNATNLQIARENNANSMQIARDNNQMQLDAMRENNAFNKQAAIDMFNMEAAYNDPSAQKQRLLAAGLNPATLYGNGSVSAGAASASTPSASGSGISPSMPSLSSPIMQAPPSVINSMFGNMETLSRLASNLTKAGLDIANKDKIKAMLSHELDKIIADTDNVRLQNAFQTMQNNFEKIFGFAKRDRELVKLTNESYKLYQDGVKAGLDGEVSKAEKLLKEAQERLVNSQNKQLAEQLPFISQQMEETINLIKEQQKTQRTQQTANLASAEQSKASADMTKEQTSQLSDMHDAIVNLAKLKTQGEGLGNRKADYELYVLRRSLGAFIKSNWAKAHLDEKSVSYLEKQIEKLQGDISWQDADHFFKNVHEAFAGFGDAVGSVLDSLKLFGIK